MNHDREFSTPVTRDTTKEGEEMAARFARVLLGSDDGKGVLKYLRAKFGVGRPVFVTGGGPFDPLAAALREGERRVMIEVEALLKAGAPNQALSEK